MTREWPEQVDHEDGNGLNNKWSNLYDVTNLENSKNQRKRSTNQSGVNGVHWNKGCEKWCSQITHEYKKINLGLFENFDDAAEARRNAEILYGYHPNHGQDRPL